MSLLQNRPLSTICKSCKMCTRREDIIIVTSRAECHLLVTKQCNLHLFQDYHAYLLHQCQLLRNLRRFLLLLQSYYHAINHIANLAHRLPLWFLLKPGIPAGGFTLTALNNPCSGPITHSRALLCLPAPLWWFVTTSRIKV